MQLAAAALPGGQPPYVCTVGDAVIDVVVELARLPVPDDDVPARITLSGGGQAANVAAWCAALGARAAVITWVADDVAGELVAAMLRRRNVELLSPPAGAPGEPRAATARGTGTILSIVTPDARRSMASDRGVSQRLAGDDVEPAWLEGCTWLHVSGYCLFGVGGGLAAVVASRLAREQGAPVSVDLSAATLVASLGPDEARRRVRACHAEVVFANEAELAAISPLEAATVVVKCGAAGFRRLDAGGTTAYSALPAAVVRDTTGAGDAFAAGWILGGAELALDAARRCVGQLGAMPPEAPAGHEGDPDGAAGAGPP